MITSKNNDSSHHLRCFRSTDRSETRNINKSHFDVHQSAHVNNLNKEGYKSVG
jgi:hypothetical protein